MIILQTVLEILDDVLNLHGAALAFTTETKLAGALPQFDSMAVVSLIAALEDRLGVSFPEERLEAAAFETVGSLVAILRNLK